MYIHNDVRSTQYKARDKLKNNNNNNNKKIEFRRNGTRHTEESVLGPRGSRYLPVPVLIYGVETLDYRQHQLITVKNGQKIPDLTSDSS